MSTTTEYTISFFCESIADANQLAEELTDSLRDAAPSAVTKRIRTDLESMDMGAALAVFLTAPVAVELAKGISNWLARFRTSKITITRPDGSIVVENIGASDAMKIARILQDDHVGKQR